MTAPVVVELRTGRGHHHDDLPVLLRHQEELGAVLLRDEGDVVHTLGWAPAPRARTGSRPWVVAPPLLRTTLSEQQVQRLLSADAVIVRSSQQRDLAHALGVPWYRLFVVPVAADGTTFHRRGPAARSTDRFRVVAESTGGDDGLMTLLSALASWDAVEVVVIAERRAATLRREARSRGLGARFVAVHPRDGAERAWWIRSAHVAAAVPTRGSPPRLALEAMACGVPVVATPVDQLEDLVVHGVTGLHVPSGDASSLARAVRSLVSDPFQREAFGMAAADRALHRYSPDRVGRDLVAVYHRVLSGPAGTDEPDDAPGPATSTGTGDPDATGARTGEDDGAAPRRVRVAGRPGARG